MLECCTHQIRSDSDQNQITSQLTSPLLAVSLTAVRCQLTLTPEAGPSSSDHRQSLLPVFPVLSAPCCAALWPSSLSSARWLGR